MENPPGIHHMNTSLIPYGSKNHHSYAKTVLDIYLKIRENGCWWDTVPPGHGLKKEHLFLSRKPKGKVKMKKSNKVLPQNASQFEKSSVLHKNIAFDAAIEVGTQLAYQTDTLATPQERTVADFALLATGQKKIPAHIAGIAGKGSDEQKVLSFANSFGQFLDGKLDSSEVYSRENIKRLKYQMSRGIRTWLEKVDHLVGYTFTSPKGSAKTCYSFEKVEVAENTPVDTVTDPTAENAAKVAGQQKAEIETAQQKGLKAGIAEGEKGASDTIARQAAEIKALQDTVTAAIVAEHHALCLAKSYALGLPANPAQRGKLTKAITASKRRATVAMATSGQTIKLATVATGKAIKAAIAGAGK
jgi:hypothetical protein